MSSKILNMMRVGNKKKGSYIVFNPESIVDSAQNVVNRIRKYAQMNILHYMDKIPVDWICNNSVQTINDAETAKKFLRELKKYLPETMLEIENNAVMFRIFDCYKHDKLLCAEITTVSEIVTLYARSKKQGTKELEELAEKIHSNFLTLISRIESNDSVELQYEHEFDFDINDNLINELGITLAQILPYEYIDISIISKNKITVVMDRFGFCFVYTQNNKP